MRAPEVEHLAQTERIIEGTWSCTSCGAQKVLARHAKCPTCNNPREGADKESDFDFGKQTASGALEGSAVSDEKALQRAAAGVDWYCGFCKTANAGTREKCVQCSADRNAKEGEGKMGTMAPAAPNARPPAPAASKAGSKRIAFGVGAATVLTLFSGLVYLGARTKEVGGEQVAAKWERTVHRETFTPIVAKGWQDELQETQPVMPANGSGEVPGVLNVRDCTREQRGTKQVPDGTKRVCETKSRKTQCGTEQKCSVTTMGNGFAKETCRDVPKYCSESYEACHDETRYRDEPVFAQKCAYDTYQWSRVDTASTKGDQDAPIWPEQTPGALDRLVREEKYAVEFKYLDDDEEKRFVAEPSNEAEFTRLRGKKTARLNVSVFSGASLAEDTP